MKIANYILAATLALLSLSCSQGNDPGTPGSSATRTNRTSTTWNHVDTGKGTETTSLRRLESITWDSVKHELTWDVSRGERQGETYQPQTTDRYEINMDKATMTVNGESRRFSEEEAANVRKLMDFVSRYALESTVWWENGEGEPVDGSGAPARPERPVPHKPQQGGKAKAIHITAMQ